MAFSIKNPETDRLARRLTEITGESLTTAVTRAIEERLHRVEPKHQQGLAEYLRGIDEIVEHASALPVLDPRSPDELLGYDEGGLPA